MKQQTFFFAENPKRPEKPPEIDPPRVPEIDIPQPEPPPDGPLTPTETPVPVRA